MLNLHSVPHCIPSRAWDRTPKLFRHPHCCSSESMTAEETTASTSLLKDCFPGSNIEEVHVLVVDMQAHMSAGFHLGTRIELRHNTPARHCQVILTQHSAPPGSERKCNVTCCTVTSPGTSGEAKQTLLHPTRVSSPRPIVSPGGVPLLRFRLLLPQLACWQQRLILAALSRWLTLPRRAW